MYVIEILRYGSEELGKHLFGVFDDLDKSIAEAKEYNRYRGGKYPVIKVTEIELNESKPFENRPYIIDLE